MFDIISNEEVVQEREMIKSFMTVSVVNLARIKIIAACQAVVRNNAFKKIKSNNTVNTFKIKITYQ
jgi:hypothetical protein